MTRRQKRKFIKIGLTLLIIGVVGLGQRQGWLEAPSTAIQQLQPGYYAVVSFADGDTIRVDMNGTEETIRLIGIDTPETSDPRKPVQCFGKSASEFTKQLIGTNSVRLESDSLSTNRDRYNRLLRYVYLPDGRMVNSEVISQGYGFAYLSFPFTKSEEFRQLAVTAREMNKGLWGSCNVTENDNGTMTSNPE